MQANIPLVRGTVLPIRRPCVRSDVSFPPDWPSRSALVCPTFRIATFLDILLAMHPLDPYRCANILMKQHGADAELQAAMRADELDAAGDEAGRRVWMLILAALDDLRRTSPAAGERIQ